MYKLDIKLKLKKLNFQFLEKKNYGRKLRKENSLNVDMNFGKVFVVKEQGVN